MANSNPYFQLQPQQPQQPPPDHYHHHHYQQQQQQQTSVPNSNEAVPSVFPSASSTATATLLVRHLPEAIPDDMLSRLFSHYGASDFRPCAGGKLRNCAFVDFKDEALASQAQAQMNRLRFLGKVLAVERVGNLKSRNMDLQSDLQLNKDSTSHPPLVLENSSSQKIHGGEPIAPRLGVDYPFPPHLEYAYPPPDGNILTNIVNTLIAVPRFYTQVLHLMNKMNLQPPFRMALPTPPLPPPVAPPPPPPPPVTFEPPRADLSSDESELESSEDDAGEKRSRKRAKREVIVGPAVDKSVAHEAVGLRPASLVPKEVPVIKKKNTVLQIKFAPRPTRKEITDDGNNTDTVEEQFQQKSYATPEDIEKLKLPPEDILSLPKFKNYAAGNPAKVLYIKNLAKDVVADDFYFVFGSLFESIESARSGLNIKLMQEGRMRGQAFVTFPSTDLAQRALNLVNGYKFKGKPMIIQFGHNPAASKTT